MELATVGPKYQIVIPKKVRRKIEHLKPGKKVGVDSVNGESIIIYPEPENWVDRTYGIMAKAWKGIDMIAEVEKGRNEWEERLAELEQIREGKNPYAKVK